MAYFGADIAEGQLKTRNCDLSGVQETGVVFWYIFVASDKSREPQEVVLNMPMTSEKKRCVSGNAVFGYFWVYARRPKSTHNESSVSVALLIPAIRSAQWRIKYP